MGRGGRRRALGLLSVAALMAALLMFAAPASADYEQAAEHFGTSVEAQAIFEGRPMAAAVNVNGVGGVEPGSVYTVTSGFFTPAAVIRFSPGAEGEEPQFREAWGWGVGNETEEFQRCGPALADEPAQHTFHTCHPPQHGLSPDEGHFSGLGGVAVDQSTGYVYVLNTPNPGHREHHLIEVFTATGVPVGEGFGDAAHSPESISQSPEKLHRQFFGQTGLAVDEAGDVYVGDTGFPEAEGGGRVMTFEPCTPSDYEHYCYATAKDTTNVQGFIQVAAVGGDRLVAANEEQIFEYPTGGGSTPICTYLVPGGGLAALTTNSLTGEVFYFNNKDEKVHRLSACDEATGKFEELQSAVKLAPGTRETNALAVNPTLSWGPLRPPGVFYAVDAEHHSATNPPLRGIGDVFVPAKSTPPAVLSESTANTTETSSTLKASIDPHGFGTRYAFQYLSEGTYEANEPNERQSLTVKATGGLFGLAYGERPLGGLATADLLAGSKVAENLTTAKGMAALHAAKGTAKLTAVTGTANATKESTTLTNVTTATGAGLLSSAEGNGTLVSGSKAVEGLVTEKGAFAVGQVISGTGIAPNTVITSVGAGTLQLSANAIASGTGVALKAASNKITSVNTTSGEFLTGQTIVGAHLPAETKITAVSGETLTLSALPSGNGPEALSAGSQPAKEGQFISGPGIPAGTTVTAVGPRTLILSNAATASGTQIAFTSASNTLTGVTTSEGSFETGETIEGEGIPGGTTITAVNPPALTLSKPVTKAGTGIAITATSTTLTGVTTVEGTFEPGTPISGVGIPAGTTITAVGSGTLEISKGPAKPGAAVAIFSSGPAPLAVGETVEGPGIPPGTKIAAIEALKLTLTNAAESTASGVHLRAGLSFDATASVVQSALEGLPTIGHGNVKVTGGPGDATGSSPYEVEFTGSFENQDLPELEADASGLSGGPATASVATAHDGGGGFDHGATEAPLGGGEVSGAEVGTATATISGLRPDSRYRFRVAAGSKCEGLALPPCEVEGKPAAFATYPEAAAGLSDHRAYELVSPADKHGGEVLPAEPFWSSCVPRECKPPGVAGVGVFPIQSTSDGNSVAYFGFPFSASEGVPVLNSYVSTRTPSGWQTTTMSPALLTSHGEDLSYSSQLSEGVLLQGNGPLLSSDAPAGYEDLYLQSAADPHVLRPLLTRAMLEALPSGEPRPPHRAPGFLQFQYGGHSPDYSAQYFAANDVLTEATPYAPEPADPGSEGRDLYEWREGKLSLVNVLPGNGSVASGARFASPEQVFPGMSPDTHAVSADSSRVFWEAGGHLYVREDGQLTTEVHDSGSFLQASPDGSEILLSDGCLYSLGTESCTDLTEGQGGFLGIAGASTDLSRIYFVDTAALAPGAEAGKDNLYAWNEEGGLRLIAALLASDGAGGVLSLNDWAKTVPGNRTAEASPDGRYLAFASSARLTGYDNVGPCGESVNSQQEFVVVDTPCQEVFLYDSATGRLTCPSCSPSGEAPLGLSHLRRIEGADAHPWLPQPRYLTNAGRLYFDSQNRLSILDTNGDVEDVYEYESQDTGSCARAAGCVTLISPGSGEVDSNLLAIDENGANVFFTTREELVQKDTDELIDVYDAREGGGFPADTESQRVECQGESCQPTPRPPQAASNASAVFEGPGNLNEAKAKKNHAKKHKHKKKAKKKRAASHNRGGAK
ncbi:MAG TPA: hypothetical protein VHU86_00165 [Solirubrobacterales bacterium]|jgi:hypothetical protein|nr:hypothetical protein [Solirubrobacterales bacterium]